MLDSSCGTGTTFFAPKGSSYNGRWQPQLHGRVLYLLMRKKLF